LGKLHSIEVPKKFKATFQNKEMRSLNHEHIFNIPLKKDNGIDLDAFSEGLTEAAQFLLDNEPYKNRVKELGKLYLNDGNTLLHGDFYPGSWLNSEGEVYIIDPEFCFMGNTTFDLGVTAAHMAICGIYSDAWNRFYSAYSAIKYADLKSTNQFAGVEIMRRTLGVAQLPISHTTEQRRKLLEQSLQWVMQ